MTPLPKRRHSTRRGGKRKAALHIDLPGLVKCAKCGANRRPHRVCRACGYYNDKSMISQKPKASKKKS